MAQERAFRPWGWLEPTADDMADVEAAANPQVVEELLGPAWSADDWTTGSTAHPTVRLGWSFLWSLRRQLWRDLIDAGLLTVEFTQTETLYPDGDEDYIEDEGTGPNLTFAASSTRLVTDGWESRWTTVADTEGPPFEWGEYALTTVDHWSDYEVEPFEECSRTRTRLTTSARPVADEHRWSSVPANEQARVLEAVLKIYLANPPGAPDEDQVSDVLAAIAVHPGSDPQVAARAKGATTLVAEVLGN